MNSAGLGPLDSLVVGTDGLWDVLSNDDVRSELAEKGEK